VQAPFNTMESTGWAIYVRVPPQTKSFRLYGVTHNSVCLIGTGNFPGA
jgi:hypothetical protein